MLVVALVAQLVLGAGLVVVAINGFPLIGGGAAKSERAPATAPAVPRPRVDHFDAPRAFALIRRELGYGQRPAGSTALRRLAEVLRRELPNGRFEAVPGHPGLRNIVGTIPGRAPAIVVGAHYDSEYHPKGFVGANDSAAGTAAVVELARALGEADGSGREVRFVLFDGEEEGPGCSERADFYAVRAARLARLRRRAPPRGRADGAARLHRQQGRAPAARGQLRPRAVGARARGREQRRRRRRLPAAPSR